MEKLSFNKTAIDSIFISKYPLKEGESDKICLFRFDNVLTRKTYTFTYQENQLYLLIKQQIFGSAFLGNVVLPQPRMFIMTKFNPIFLMLIVISNVGKSEMFIDVHTALEEYKNSVKNLKNNSLEFVQKIFNENIDKIHLICEVKNDGSELSFKLSESKIFCFLNSRVNPAVEELETIPEGDREAFTTRRVREKCEIIAPFIPEDIMNKFTQYKGISLNPQKNVIENKKHKDNNNKGKTKMSNVKHQKNKKERNPGQNTIENFFSGRKVK